MNKKIAYIAPVLLLVLSACGTNHHNDQPHKPDKPSVTENVDTEQKPGEDKTTQGGNGETTNTEVGTSEDTSVAPVEEFTKLAFTKETIRKVAASFDNPKNVKYFTSVTNINVTNEMFLDGNGNPTYMYAEMDNIADAGNYFNGVYAKNDSTAKMKNSKDGELKEVDHIISETAFKLDNGLIFTSDATEEYAEEQYKGIASYMDLDKIGQYVAEINTANGYAPEFIASVVNEVKENQKYADRMIHILDKETILELEGLVGLAEMPMEITFYQSNLSENRFKVQVNATEKYENTEMVNNSWMILDSGNTLFVDQRLYETKYLGDKVMMKNSNVAVGTVTPIKDSDSIVLPDYSNFNKIAKNDLPQFATLEQIINSSSPALPNLDNVHAEQDDVHIDFNENPKDLIPLLNEAKNLVNKTQYPTNYVEFKDYFVHGSYNFDEQGKKDIELNHNFVTAKTYANNGVSQSSMMVGVEKYHESVDHESKLVKTAFIQGGVTETLTKNADKVTFTSIASGDSEKYHVPGSDIRIGNAKEAITATITDNAVYENAIKRERKENAIQVLNKMIEIASNTEMGNFHITKNERTHKLIVNINFEYTICLVDGVLVSSTYSLDDKFNSEKQIAYVTIGGTRLENGFMHREIITQYLDSDIKDIDIDTTGYKTLAEDLVFNNLLFK